LARRTDKSVADHEGAETGAGEAWDTRGRGSVGVLEVEEAPGKTHAGIDAVVGTSVTGLLGAAQQEEGEVICLGVAELLVDGSETGWSEYVGGDAGVCG
jgi:hypothetical protein